MSMIIRVDELGTYRFGDGDMQDSGSYSRIYRAQRKGAGGPPSVAVKVMLDRGPEAEELLRKEYECLRRLGKESADEFPALTVPRAYGLARIEAEEGFDGRLALAAMEYFDPKRWPSLRVLLDELAKGETGIDGAPGKWVTQLGGSIARTIEACHGRGVVHRDLSDTNVLVRRDSLACPEIIVIDFGTAEQADRWERTSTGEIKTRGLRGTNLFESPEMRDAATMLEYRKKPTTDLFGAGAMLVYCRLSMEYGCRAAAKAMEENGGFAYQLVPLLDTLSSDTRNQKYPITVADMEIGGVARRLTAYHPASRYFIGMTPAQRMDMLLSGYVENSANLQLGDRPLLESRLDGNDIKKLVRLATPMTFQGIAMKTASLVSGKDVKTVVRPKDGHAWLHEDGTLVIVPSDVELKEERMREEYSHGRAVREWENIDVGDESASHPWNTRNVEVKVQRVIAPVMVNSDGAVQRLAPLTMRGWFEGLSDVRQFDLAGIDTSSVTDMADLFRDCFSLVELILPATWSYRRVRTMERMFSGCRQLRKMSFLSPLADRRQVFDTSQVRSFRKLFEGCARLGDGTDEGLACTLDTSGAQYLDSMFSGCSSVRGLDLSGFKTEKVTGFSSMFEACSSLEWVRQGFSMRSARWTESMFRNCSKIEEIVLPEEVKPTNQLPQRAHPSCMFAGCSSLRRVELGGLLNHPLTSVWHLFADCSNLVEVSLSGMDTDGVQDFGGAFAACESLERVVGISELYTGSATTFGMMFSGCRSLKELDLGHWDTRSLRSFSHMFRDCASLQKVDMSGWDTSSVTAIGYAFDGANGNMDIIGSDKLKFPQIKDESQYVRFAPPEFARRFGAS